QRRQMTTVPSPNVHAVAVAGTFDDCQDLVKAAFADAAFRDEVRLSAVNSINWARVMAQVVYYVTAHLAVAPDGGPVSFVVPTGNFGNIFAGWAAKRMGLPVDRLVVASNRNDVLTRFFTTGTMEIREVVPTTSPSMDIQVSSNLERLLFEVLDRDGAAVASLMSRFREDGTVSVEAAILERLRDEFDCGRVDDESAAEVIRRTHGRRGMLLDPHTAVGVGIAEGLEGDPSVPVVSLATAHPAKFPDAVEAATGVRPELPPHLADLFEREERIERVPADLAAVESLVRSRIAPARAARQGWHHEGRHLRARPLRRRTAPAPGGSHPAGGRRHAGAALARRAGDRRPRGGEPVGHAARQRRRQPLAARLRPGRAPHRTGADRGGRAGAAPRAGPGRVPLQPVDPGPVRRRRRHDGRLRRRPPDHRGRGEGDRGAGRRAGLGCRGGDLVPPGRAVPPRGGRTALV